MKGAIFGFQRCWRWPKWAPDSRSWRMENSGKAIDSVSFTGWPDARVIPLRRHRTATMEYPPKATHACEMAGLIRRRAPYGKGFGPVFRGKAARSGPKAPKAWPGPAAWP